MSVLNPKWLRPIPRVAALLCLTVTVGYLAGTLQERQSRPVVAVTPAAFLPPNVPVATDAEAADFEWVLGRLRSEMTAAKTDAERIALAKEMHQVGLKAHHQDKGQGRVAVAAYEEALLVFGQVGERQQFATVMMDLADAVQILGDQQRAQECWRQALEQGKAATPTDPNWLPQCQMRYGEFCRTSGDYKTARTTLETALQQLRTNKSDAGTAHALRHLGTVYSDTGDYVAAKKSLNESIALFTNLGEVNTRAAVQGTLGDVYLREGHIAEADRLYQEGLTYWQSKNHKYWTAVFLARRSHAAYWRSDFPTAQKLAMQSGKMLDTSNGPMGRILPLRVLGLVARAKGEFSKAKEWHEQSLALSRQMRNPRSIAEGLEALALDYALTDGSRNPQVAKLLNEASTLRRNAGIPLPPLDRPTIDPLLKIVGDKRPTPRNAKNG